MSEEFKPFTKVQTREDKRPGAPQSLCQSIFEVIIYFQYVPTVYQMCLSETSLAQSLGLCSSIFADTKHCIDSVNKTLLKLTEESIIPASFWMLLFMCTTCLYVNVCWRLGWRPENDR